jgi:hypothetical protein
MGGIIGSGKENSRFKVDGIEKVVGGGGATLGDIGREKTGGKAAAKIEDRESRMARTRYVEKELGSF